MGSPELIGGVGTLISVVLTSPAHLDSVPLPIEDYNAPTQLTFDDETLEIRRTDRQEDWAGLEVPPGERLTARVGINNALTIRYRRSGFWGRFERRSLVIFGYA